MKRVKHNESRKTPPDLPADVRREILLRVPARSLVRLRAVCRSWLSAIDDPNFARSHTDRRLPSDDTLLVRITSGPPFAPLYSLDLEALYLDDGPNIVSAAAFRRPGFPSPPHLPAANCDGLLLLADKFWAIWNPTTGELLQLPRGGYTADVAASGLGYHPAAADYRAVVIDRLPLPISSQAEPVCRIHIYSLRSNSWRILGSPPPSSRLEGPGVFLNGALHWISQGPGGIFAFDLQTDTFRQVGEPPAGNHRRGAPAGNWYLDVFDGSLVLSRYNNIDYRFSSQFELWVMKEYGVSDSWVRLLSAKDRRNFEIRLPPVVYVKGGRKILKMVRGGFCLFDLKSRWSRSVGVGGRKIGCADMSAQVVQGSVFRLHDNCGVDEGHVARGKRRRFYFCLKDARCRDFITCDSCHVLEPNWCNFQGEEED
ncbi:Unknown protein [Striga hermonthica]|uniref:F-box domain-containing protein n=1 Tax=Striga hermonthica TaxID=68872 RepID=A0A9N7NH69_STRHE|nr:Unknown protein [Striga hermonthica]